MRDAVGEFLDNQGGGTTSSDLSMAPWNGRDLEDAVQLLVGRNEHLDEHDARLMLCYVSGRDVIVDLPEDTIRSPMMRDFLESLESLDPEAPDWDDIGPFLEAVAELDIERHRRATDTAVETVVALVDKAQRDFEEELAYLDLHSSVAGWADEATPKAWLIGEALVIVDELLQRLEEYRPVRPQASTRAEETERAAERLGRGGPDTGRCRAMARTDGPTNRSGRRRFGRQMGRPYGGRPGGCGRCPTERGAREPARRSGPLRRADSERQVEHEGLASQRDDLAAERDSLQAEIARLDDELSSSRETVKIWRLAGVSARVDEAGLPASGQTEYRTVKDAVARAEKLFPDRLAVALNSKSDKRSQFQKPQEVFDALAWLATDYHHRRANPGGSPDFDKLLKESCPGWSYKSSQTEITREQFEEWYTTTWDGRRYVLNPHLGKGISYDPQNTIRIAFDWDDDRKRVVVGYIGMHQRNRKS